MTTTQKTSLSLVAYFIKSYPKQSLTVVLALLLAGVAETLGIGALLPLISMVIEGEGAQDNSLAKLVIKAYDMGGIEPTIKNLLSTIVIMIALKAVIIYRAMRFVSYVAADVARDMRLQLIQALMKARWHYFIKLSLGKVANIISSEAQRAGHCYMLASRTMAAFIQSLVYILAAFIVSWEISLLAIVMGGLVGFLVKRFIQMARNAGADMTRTTNDMLSRLNESLAAVKPLKAMAQEDRYLSHLEKDTTAVMNAQKEQYRASLLLQIIHEPMAVILLATGLYYVLIYTETPVSFVILLAFLFYRLMTQVNLLQNFYQNMVQNEPAVWGMIEQIQLADKEQEILHSGDTPTLNKEIHFKNLTLSYDKNSPVFKDFSDKIPANRLTVLFGPSGIGKTTLIDAILGLMQPDSGKILIDNKPMSNIDILKWRQMVGYVPQETFMFHDTILQNVTLGDGLFSEEDARIALKASAAWPFIEELPEELHTIVGERGGRLSGGQRQRIALARALIRKPTLLVLDEATTGLDKSSQDLVFNSIQALSGKVTVVAITHDPAILDLADHVIKLGQIKGVHG